MRIINYYKKLIRLNFNMGNNLFNCYKPKIEEIEIVKTDKNKELKNSLNDFILTLKRVNRKKRKHKILKLKLKQTLMIENKRIYNISSFPCGNFILITDTGIIYIYDNKFNLLHKQENNKYKELFIRDNTTFITYGESKINVWKFKPKNNILNSLCLIDTKLLINKVSILINGDIIGITESNRNYKGPFQCFIYEKTKNNIYQKKTIIKYNSYILSFLIIKNNSELVILYYNEINYAIDIYDYKNLKLKRKYEEKIYHLNSDTKNFLFHINQNVFSFVHIDRRITTLPYPRDYIIIYDNNNENKIILSTSIFSKGKLEYFPKMNCFINYYYLVGLQANFIYILLKEKKYNRLHYLDIDFNFSDIDFSDFFKINENELCLYNKENSEIKIFEFIG